MEVLKVSLMAFHRRANLNMLALSEKGHVLAVGSPCLRVASPLCSLSLVY